jgi:CRP-like cAMP-binding protein
LNQLPLFKDLPSNFLISLAEYSTNLTCEEGNNPVQLGVKNPSLFFIADGCIDVTSTSEGTPYLDTVGPGDVFGEFKQEGKTIQISSATVVSTTAEIVCLSKQATRLLLDNFPEYHRLIILEIEKRFRSKKEVDTKKSPSGSSYGTPQSRRKFFDSFRSKSFSDSSDSKPLFKSSSFGQLFKRRNSNSSTGSQSSIASNESFVSADESKKDNRMNELKSSENEESKDSIIDKPAPHSIEVKEKVLSYANFLKINI